MIREYRPSDIEDVLEIWREASRVAHPFLTEAFITEEEGKIRDVYVELARTWVYEEDGTVMGFISLIENEVGALFVRPANLGRGIGTRLMDMAHTLHDTLELEVFEDNPIGRAFYRKYGFEVISRHIHPESGQPALRLRHQLHT